MTGEATWLLAGLLFAHFVGDFTPLATARMHEAKADGGPVAPILQHAAVHGALSGIVLMLLSGVSWSLVLGAAAVVLASHFLLDLTRARVGLRLQSSLDPGRQAFWVALGADQLAHGLVLVGVASWIL